MSDAASWWAKKLGNPAAQPQSTPDTWNLPRHQAPTAPHMPPPPAVVPQQLGEQQVYQDAPAGQMHVGDAILRWRGGEGTWGETTRCPKCHSGNYFSRKSETKITQNGAAPPAPQCFDCGYNGIYTLFGGD